jgi:hypothetical protein
MVEESLGLLSPQSLIKILPRLTTSFASTKHRARGGVSLTSFVDDTMSNSNLDA